MMANVSVTVDGTCQKRGLSSKMGVVFVISVESGENPDYEVNFFFHYCKVRSSCDQESEE
jgi:hypothetical protein